MYKKRAGTSGIRGQLYETKLISLIYFRAIHDDTIEEFNLATNVDKIGTFDDICFRAKVKDFDKPVAVFIQAKHKENEKILTLNNKNELVKYFDSYLKISREFDPSNENVLFKGEFNETECLFVLYTTANGDDNEYPYEGEFADHLNDLIGTDDSGSQPSYTFTDVELLCQEVRKEHLSTLAQQMAEYICNGGDCDMFMNTELMLRYHVLLGKDVFNVSGIIDDPSGHHRIASFRYDFFDLDEPLPLLFKDALCSEILKRRMPGTSKPLTLTGEDSSIEILVDLIGSVIVYKNGVFEPCDKIIPEGITQAIKELNGSPMAVRELVEFAMNKCFPSLEFKVSAMFGNKDLSIRGNDAKVARRINHLTKKIVELIETSASNNIITIDESLGDGFLQLSGGIASAVGNILIYDDKSKLLKFRDDCNSLGKNAKALFEKLEDKINNLQKYKLDVKVKKFPKLSFRSDEYDNLLVHDFFSKLIFYTNQSDENGVEETLKQEIYDNKSRAHNAGVRSDAIFLKYHDNVQKWWMIPKEGSYLTKESEIYINAEKTTLSQPLMNVLDMIQKIKTKDYTFKEEAMNILKLHDQPSGTVIITENTILTVAKLIQYSKNKDLVVLDFEYILNLPTKDHKTLCSTELTNTDKVKSLIFVFDKVEKTSNSCKRLKSIANAIEGKNVLIVTDKISIDIVKEYFSLTDDNIVRDKNYLTDMSEESQMSILNNSKVIFQGDEVNLVKIIDKVTIMYVEGDVIRKIMQSDKNRIGKSVSNPNYDKLSIYIERTLSPIELKPTENIDNVLKKYSRKRGLHLNRSKVKKNPEDSLRAETLYDITDHIRDDGNALIIADPGMGKSTLLTNLSIRTKQLDLKVWILRINLLEYAREFSEWQDKKAVIDTLESLNFMCRVAVSAERDKMRDVEITLEESEGVVYLKDCTGDEWTVFELKMFLHFYNDGRLIFILDGFDEICPHYAHEVLTLIKVMKTFPLKHKMLITSRSYNKINTMLELQFATYEIDHLSYKSQLAFLKMIWEEKFLEVTDDQMENIFGFIRFMSQSEDIKMLLKKDTLPIQSRKQIPILMVYFCFIQYLKSALKNLPASVADILYELFENAECEDDPAFMNEFVSTPLHLSLMADYLHNKIREVDNSPDKWDLDTNIFNIYEAVLENKLKTIRFQEKKQMDMYNPDNIISYKNEYKDFISKHKKLAAYAVFHRYHNKLFDTKELEDFKDMITVLKEGEEKTGIICNVVNDVPMFVHSSFAEYFAVEYICDLLKSKDSKEIQKSLWDFVLNVMFFNCNMNILYTFDVKIKVNEDLTAVVEKYNKVISKLLLKQSKDIENKQDDMKSSLCEAIRNDLRNLSILLLSTIENNLDENNLMDFVKTVTETKMLTIAINMEFEELIVTIIESVRRIDKSKLITLFENIENFEIIENIDEVSTDELVHKLHIHVWTRMDIVPDWSNLSELSGQIYFI